MTNGWARAGGAPFSGSAGSVDDDSRERSRRVGRTLWVAVAVLGLATFAVSFSSPTLLGVPVRLAVLAATVAVAGLLPGQKGGGWIAVALALAGFLDALAALITADELGWVITVVFALNALQSLAAVGALLVEARTRPPAATDGGQTSSAYDGFVAAYQAYAAQYQQAASQYYGAGQASAQVHATAEAPAHVARAPGDAAQETLRARYAQHGGYSTAEGSASSTRPSSARSSADPGLPEANHVVPQPPQYRMAPQHPGEASST